MPHWRSLSEHKYLGHWDFEDLNGTPKDRKLTIKGVRQQTVENNANKERKPVIYFAEEKLGLVAGAQVCTAIESWAGSSNTDKWTGLQVTLFSTVDRGPKGTRVRCVRVHPKPRTESLAEKVRDNGPPLDDWDDPDRGP